MTPGQRSPEDPTGSVVEVLVAFLRLGFTAFGGPIAHLGYFRREFVERRQWLSEAQYGQLMALCQFLPGPASSQLGFVLGLTRAGWGGAVVAFLAFTLPSVVLLVAFASLLPYLSGAMGQAIVSGLKLVACAVVADAVLGMAKNLCPDAPRRVLAVAVGCALLLFPGYGTQLAVIVLAGLAGLALGRGNIAQAGALTLPHGVALGSGLLLVFALLLVASLALPPQSAEGAMAQVFYRAGALVFGGGHVVLPLLDEGVVASGWVSVEDFTAGYGAAQAIPGPLFAFSAYLGALVPGVQSPAVGATVALLSMFLPGFLLVAGVLPWWQRVAANRHAVNAVAGINAAVVGILAVALYDPILQAGVQSPYDLAVALVGFAMLRKWQLTPLLVVAWCVVATVVPVMISS